LNPFNNLPLTKEELENDCLCFMTYEATPVKASRLFAGNEHEQQVKRISEHFNQSVARFRVIEYNAGTITKLQKKNISENSEDNKINLKTSLFAERNLDDFENDEEAYHRLMLDIVKQQFVSTQLVLKGTSVKRIFVDGGFSANAIYMNLLAAAFPKMEVFAASMAQATALGAALAVHKAWNSGPLPPDMIRLQFYALTQDPVL